MGMNYFNPVCYQCKPGYTYVYSKKKCVKVVVGVWPPLTTLIHVSASAVMFGAATPPKREGNAARCLTVNKSTRLLFEC